MNKKYELRNNHELWTTGEHSFFCGFVSDPANLDAAIDAHEEEMRCLLTDARAEFGLDAS